MDRIYCGDVHGNFKFLSWLVKAHKIEESAIIQVGDFGIGFDPPEVDRKNLERLSLTLKKQNVLLYVVRGNHDDPSYFDGNFTDFDNIFLVPDYSVIRIGEKNHLFVGGAISVDRTSRTLGVDMWKGEEFILDESRLEGLTGIDVLVTHNCMSFLTPVTVNSNILKFCESDPDLLTDISRERMAISLMWHILARENLNKIELHVYGHYHFSHTTFVEDTKHVLLGIEKTLYARG